MLKTHPNPFSDIVFHKKRSLIGWIETAGIIVIGPEKVVTLFKF
jgi:hypothetical protein